MSVAAQLTFKTMKVCNLFHFGIIYHYIGFYCFPLRANVFVLTVGIAKLYVKAQGAIVSEERVLMQS